MRIELPDVSQQESSCRICLDPLGEEDCASGTAIRLGCRCSASGSDLMHRECASQWFGQVRRSTICEVCSAEAVGLPLEVRGHISWLAGHFLSPRQAQQPSSSSFRGFSSMPAFLGNYAAFCLLPAMLGCLLLTFFYIRIMAIDFVAGVALSVGLSMVTIVHWLCFPQRRLLHFMFVVTLLGSAIAGTLLSDALASSWSPSAKAAIGSVGGVIIGELIFYGTFLVGVALSGASRPQRARSTDAGFCLFCMQCSCWSSLRSALTARWPLPQTDAVDPGLVMEVLSPLSAADAASAPLAAAVASEGQAVAFMGHSYAREQQDLVWATGTSSTLVSSSILIRSVSFGAFSRSNRTAPH